MADRTLFIFSDYVCPFCYVAAHEAVRSRGDPGVAFEPAAFELRPRGTRLQSLDDPAMRQSWEAVEPVAAQLGVAMAYPTFTTRTRKAHEAVAWARQLGAAGALHARIFQAYWQHGRDIGRIDVLMEIAGEAGLDRMGLKVALDIDQCTERVEQDEAWAAQLGLRAVPAYVLAPPDVRTGTPAAGSGLAVAGRIWVGMRRHEELRDWVAGNDDV